MSQLVKYLVEKVVLSKKYNMFAMSVSFAILFFFCVGGDLGDDEMNDGFFVWQCHYFLFCVNWVRLCFYRACLCAVREYLLV